MTKLEEKLIQLGYKKAYDNTYIKKSNTFYWLTLEVYEQDIFGSVYSERRKFRYQNQIDNLQQAFNQLQQDLEVLNSER